MVAAVVLCMESICDSEGQGQSEGQLPMLEPMWQL